MEFTTYEPGVPSEGLTLIDDGDHVCKIVEAVQQWNNNGVSVYRVKFMPRINAEGCKWPVLNMPDNSRGVTFGKALADALGIDRSVKLSLPPEQLIGRVVTINTKRFSSEDGRQGVNVESISAGPQKAAKQVSAKPVAGKTKPAPEPVAAVAEAPAREPGSDDDADFPF